MFQLLSLWKSMFAINPWDKKKTLIKYDLFAIQLTYRITHPLESIQSDEVSETYSVLQRTAFLFLFSFPLSKELLRRGWVLIQMAANFSKHVWTFLRVLPLKLLEDSFASFIWCCIINFEGGVNSLGTDKCNSEQILLNKCYAKPAW